MAISFRFVEIDSLQEEDQGSVHNYLDCRHLFLPTSLSFTFIDNFVFSSFNPAFITLTILYHRYLLLISMKSHTCTLFFVFHQFISKTYGRCQRSQCLS